MERVDLNDADLDLAALTRRVESGETIVVTRDGKPVADLVPHRRRGGIDIAAGEAFLRAAGIVRRPGFIAPDFDDPLPEDVLLQLLPEPLPEPET